MTELFVRNPDFVLTDEITDFTKLTAIPRWCDVGACSLDLPLSSISVALSEPGAGIVVQENGVVLFSGVTSQPERHSSATSDGQLLSFVSDEVLLHDRLAFQGTPVLQGDGVTYKCEATSYDVRVGPGESVMYAYAKANAGPISPTYPWSRPIPSLTFGPDLGRGPSVTGQARMPTLLELEQNLATVSGLGFRVLDMEFSVVAPVDRSAAIAFSTEIGNLQDYRYARMRPTATHIVVAGAGTGTDRVFYINGDNTAASRWGWSIEMFRDRSDTADVDELMQSFNEEMAKNAETSSFSLTPLDIPGYAFGHDYNLGDLVTGEVDGTAVTGSIKQVTITLDDNGRTVAPDFSSGTGAQATFVLKTFDLLRDQQRRISALERNH